MADPSAPPREPLTRDRIFAAALEIIDTDGLSALSMRRLGASLGVEAMAIYHHVPNKEALLAGVADLLYSSGSSVPEGLGWREGLHRGAGTLRATLEAHPAAAPLIMGGAPRTDSSVRWVEGPLAMLTDAGFATADAVGLFHATIALLFGWITLEGASLRRSSAEAAIPDDLAAAAPNLTKLAPALDDWSTGFDEALDALFDSWERRLPPGAKGARRAGAKARPAGASAWIVEKGGASDKGHKKDKAAKKKSKGKKKA